MTSAYQALLIVSFGGPEGPEDLLPFLENVSRGRNVPKTRLEEIKRNYESLGGKSPINEQNRSLIAALNEAFRHEGFDLPIFFGNRNWKPYIKDALEEMRDAGVRKALAFFTSSMSSYSGCRQYLENISDARRTLGADAPEIHKLRAFYNHPLFIEAASERVRKIMHAIPAPPEKTHYLFTAHSIPLAMARRCDYEEQFKESTCLVAEKIGASSWSFCYQSRSGPPEIPWLGPSLSERCKALQREGFTDLVVVPLGFLSDHFEILYDLDQEARALVEGLGLRFHRVPTVGTHPKFIAMICELVRERLDPKQERRAFRTIRPSPGSLPHRLLPYILVPTKT